MAARLLTPLESAVLRAISAKDPADTAPADLVAGARHEGLNRTVQGCCRSADSLVRKGLVSRTSDPFVLYRVYESGRRALAGDLSGRWRARPVTAEGDGRD